MQRVVRVRDLLQSGNRSDSWTARYGLAVATSLAALAFAWQFHRPLAELSPFIVFYIAVAVSSWYGGFGPGCVAVALGALACDYYVLEPRFVFGVKGPAAMGRLLLFGIVGTLIAWLNGQLLLASARCERAMVLAQASEARAKRLAESNLIAVFFSDLEGHVHSGNDEFLRLAGCTREELAAGPVNWRDLTAPEHRPLDENALDELRRCRICTPFEKDHLLRDGRRIPVLMGCALLNDEAEQCVGYLMDLTAQRRAEAETLAYQERLAALSSELAEAEGRERRRIAMVLHDSIGQALLLARLKVEGIIAAAADAAVLQRCEMKEVERLLLAVIQQTRALTSELSPPVLFELGLVPALRWMAARTTAQHGLPVDVEADPSSLPPLSEKTRVMLFESACELLRNVVKHARATHCLICICSMQGLLRLTVRDDGVGFDPHSSDQAGGNHDGFGLFSVRERLRRLGGRLEIHALPSRGANVTVELPLDSRQESQAPGKGTSHERQN